MKRLFKHKRYAVQAKRKDTNEKWTEWTSVDDYDDAVKHRNRAEELGLCARIVDREQHKKKRIERECNGLDEIH